MQSILISVTLVHSNYARVLHNLLKYYIVFPKYF